MRKIAVNKKGLACGIVSAALGVISPASAELVRDPTHVGTNIDIGQIIKGEIYDGSSAPSGPTRRQTITRAGVYLTESGTYNGRLAIKLTIGGLFWYALPESNDFQDRRIQFGPGVGEAQGIYSFGEDPETPFATLQFGLFPHKYTNSSNLGEYLYRSGTYPGTIVTGGWSYLNAAAYMAQGLRLKIPMFDNLLTHDFTLYMERDLEPAHDLTPGYMLTAKAGAFKIGAGLVWSHAISLNSDRLAPETDDNAYDVRDGIPVKMKFDDPTPDSLKAYYTFKGFKTAGFASVDFGTLIGSDVFKTGDFTLYTEIALLGIENQPFYYENRAHRRPIMVGVNIPTFGLLDRLNFEYEQLSSSFPNSNATVLQSQLPLPVSNPSAIDLTKASFNDPKWSIYAKRNIIEGVNLHVQAASDHLRHFNRSATPGAISATPKSNEWYYVVRLDFGI